MPSTRASSPSSDAPTDPLVALMREQLSANRDERREQTAAFVGELRASRTVHSADLRGLRADLRVIGVLGLLVLAALAGVQVVYGGARPASLTVGAAPAGVADEPFEESPVDAPQDAPALEAPSLGVPGAAAAPYDPMAGGFAP